jgi:hypothetical protein
MGKEPWEAWYHCMCNTYGTWLRGDSRGWRERDHRRHVDGDYRRPPPEGTFEEIRANSKSSMKRDPIRLDRELRRIALSAVVECLTSDGILILAACLDGAHLHLLARFKDLRPRRRLGWAKFHATKRVKEYWNAHGAAVGNFPKLKIGDGIWGKRSQCAPIRDREHRLNTLNYIAKHQKFGAALWLNPDLGKRNHPK